MRKKKWWDAESDARRDGVEQLRQDADKALKKNARKLAALLVAKGLGGSVASVKILVDLAEKKTPGPQPGERPLITLRQRLDAERKLPPDAPIEPWPEGSPEAEWEKEARAAG
jgi:hypothetical protein